MSCTEFVQRQRSAYDSKIVSQVVCIEAVSWNNRCFNNYPRQVSPIEFGTPDIVPVRENFDWRYISSDDDIQPAMALSAAASEVQRRR